MATYTIIEGRTLSPRAIVYYFKHKKQLQDKRCLARVNLTKHRGGSWATNIIQSIDSTYSGDMVFVERDGERLDVNPLFKMQKGDILVHVMFMDCEYWSYDGDKLTHLEYEQYLDIIEHRHVLLTRETCNCDKTSEQECPVCDWGLGVCAVCGAAECELLDMPRCPGHRNFRDSDGDIKKEFLGEGQQ